MGAKGPKSMAEQLAALAKAKPQVIQKSASGHARFQSSGVVTLFLELPLWGTVASLGPADDFGFLYEVAGRTKVFFHVNSRQPPGLIKGSPVSIGDKVLFALGTDVRHSNKTSAVRWARALDLPWEDLAKVPTSQVTLDALRKVAFGKLATLQLIGLMQADWYAAVCGDPTAPDRLLDSVRDAAFFERIASLNLQELADLPTPAAGWMRRMSAQPHRVKLLQWYLLWRKGAAGRDWEQWFQARESDESAVAEFFIDQRMKPNDITGPWMEKLIASGGLDAERVWRWAEGDTQVAVRCFTHLPQERRQALSAHWLREPQSLLAALAEEPALPVQPLIQGNVLAVDLESDGQSIWELGCARAGQAHMLFGKGLDTELDTALAQLQTQLGGAPLVVGHNIVAWDWPILAQRIPISPPPVLWDTLLMHYLLEPQARSHALGGSHHADTDALAAAQLFEQQFKQLPPSFAVSLLTGAFKDTQALLEAVVEWVGTRTPACARAMPDWLRDLDASNAVLVLPERLLRALDWVPGIAVVSANSQEDVPAQWLQVNADVLADALAQQGAKGDDAFAQAAQRVLLAVARHAAAQGIALRRNMVAPWLLEGNDALKAALALACRPPDPGERMRCVALLPRDVAPLLAAGLEAFLLMGFSTEVLVFDLQPDATAPESVAALAPEHRQSPLLRIEDTTGKALWLQADRASGLLSKKGGWQSFRTAVLPKEQVLAPLAAKGVTHRPVLATRRVPALHPGAQSQADYWIEVIRTFREVADRRGGKAVPVLLVGSTRSAELVTMLRRAVADIGWGEVPLCQRSQRESLLRAARYNFAVVDTLERWPQWQALAQSAGVALLPVVEALPLEQWYAAAQTQWAQPFDGDAEDVACDSDDVASLDALEFDLQADLQAELHGAEEGEELPREVVVQDALETASLAGVADPTVAHALGNVLAVNAGSLLEQMPRLLEQFLDAWLADTGLAESQTPAVLVDARAAGVGKNLEVCAELLPLHGQVLSTPELNLLNLVFDKLHIHREAAPSDYASMEQFLVQNWQPRDGSSGGSVRGFKASQKPAMQAICNRQNDVLCALPTGEGKSVLFQVPALCSGLRTRRLTVVISPLKALMHDQVEGLRGLGFAESADYLSSDRPAHEIAEVMQGVLDHRIVLLYVAPERFRSDPFIQVLRKRLESDDGLEYAVVDETHCVNQWGHEFRPDYFYALQWLLRHARRGVSGSPTPFLLLSATITASDKQALQTILLTGCSVGEATLPLVVVPKEFEQPLRAHIQVQPQRMRGMMSDNQAFEQVLEERLPAIVSAIAQAQSNEQKTGQRSAVIIFVSRRDHAEKVATKLGQLCPCRVDFFHAGLDALTRTEVYQSFRNGTLNVLVATKAFGMGMDIPDIHWAIHLSPPAFLEDYLQEVGRIGRGTQQRAKAQLEQLNAGLLYSAADFESIRSQRAQGALQLAFIKEQYKELVAQARPLDGGWLALIPHEGFKPALKLTMRRAHATKLRMALYWMERARCIELCGSVPNLLPVDVHPQTLHRIAEERGALSVVARVILGVESIHQAAERSGMSHAESNAEDTASHGTAGTWLGRVLEKIGDMVGLLFESGATTVSVAAHVSNASPATGAEAAGGNALINLSQIMLHCSFRTLSDVMASLVDLEKRGGITLVQRYQFAVRPLGSERKPEIHRLFGVVEAASLALLRRLSITGVDRFVPSDLLQGHLPLAAVPEKTNLYLAALQWGVIQLVRATGVRVRQTVTSDQKAQWEAILSPSAVPQAVVHCKKTLTIAQTVFDMLAAKYQSHNAALGTASSDADKNNVSLQELVDATRAGLHPGQRFRESDLKKALGLLSAMNLISLSGDLLPMSYVLHLDELDVPLDTHQDLWDELKQVNDLAKLRNDAMEVFANLPLDAQNRFVEGYFSQADTKGLEAFIEAQLGNIDGGNDQGLSSFIEGKLEQLRATEVGKFFDLYKGQKNQWAALSHPYDQHLLVNAGPGSGKTSVLVGRVLHLIREQHIQPADIIVLAFNRAIVFEIRKRLQSLFRSMGYGAYVKRLRVFTFHAFAMRSLAAMDGGGIGLSNVENVLDVFAQRLESESAFRQQVAGGCRSILVDEFQDVSHPIYQIIRQLHLGSGGNAGVMVIGDDDQDIQRWQRKKRITRDTEQKYEFAEKYFEQFAKDFGQDNSAKLLLDINFRSGHKIVDSSQKRIAELLEKNTQSRRVKNEVLKAKDESLQNTGCQSIDVRGQSWPEILSCVESICRKHGLQEWGTLAILCRTNAEVAQTHRDLSRIFPRLSAQGNSNFRVATMRHVALWIEWLETAEQIQNQVLTDGLQQELITTFRQKFDIPENRDVEKTVVRLEDLWDFCCAEQSFPHLSDLISFIKDLKTDDLDRLLGSSTKQTQMVVSTIHKVKGLEFDTVIILPSVENFGQEVANQADLENLEKDAAEEIRLYYVGMTRAKSRLFYFLGHREYAWSQFPPVNFKGQSSNGSILVGSHKEEVSLGWGMRVSGFNTDPEACQVYIEKEVVVGDAITLGGRGGGAFKELWHRGGNGGLQQIGYLANGAGQGGPNSSLKVSAVVRFKADDDANGAPLVAQAASVQRRGWGYVVLVSGLLR